MFQQGVARSRLSASTSGDSVSSGLNPEVVAQLLGRTEKWFTRTAKVIEDDTQFKNFIKSHTPDDYAKLRAEFEDSGECNSHFDDMHLLLDSLEAYSESRHTEEKKSNRTKIRNLLAKHKQNQLSSQGLQDWLEKYRAYCNQTSNQPEAGGSRLSASTSGDSVSSGLNPEVVAQLLGRTEKWFTRTAKVIGNDAQFKEFIKSHKPDDYAKLRAAFEDSGECNSHFDDMHLLLDYLEAYSKSTKRSDKEFNRTKIRNLLAKHRQNQLSSQGLQDWLEKYRAYCNQTSNQPEAGGSRLSVSTSGDSEASSIDPALAKELLKIAKQWFKAVAKALRNKKDFDKFISSCNPSDFTNAVDAIQRSGPLRAYFKGAEEFFACLGEYRRKKKDTTRHTLQTLVKKFENKELEFEKIQDWINTLDTTASASNASFFPATASSSRSYPNDDEASNQQGGVQSSWSGSNVGSYSDQTSQTPDKAMLALSDARFMAVENVIQDRNEFDAFVRSNNFEAYFSQKDAIQDTWGFKDSFSETDDLIEFLLQYQESQKDEIYNAIRELVGKFRNSELQSSEIREVIASSVSSAHNSQGLQVSSPSSSSHVDPHYQQGISAFSISSDGSVRTPSYASGSQNFDPTRVLTPMFSDMTIGSRSPRVASIFSHQGTDSESGGSRRDYAGPNTP